MSITVDQYVESNIAPEQQDIVRALRQLMRECAPNTEEHISYAMPVWKGERILAYMNHNERGITFSFVRGVEFEDKYGLLRGVGKSARYVKMKALKDINEEALRYYIQQALEHDAR